MTVKKNLKARQIDPALWVRIGQTIACRDADVIPKVPNAGRVVDSEHGPLQIMHNGVVIREGCYCGDWMTEIIERLRGHHEPQEELAFHTIVSRLVEESSSPTMIEIGAFWSYYSLWLLKMCPNATTVLVEPDPNNLRVGRENFRLNGFEGLFIQSAVGPVDSSPIQFLCESDGETRSIENRSLQTIAREAGLSKVDVLLIDAQGVEADVLEAAQDWIKESVRFLVVSTHHHSISGDPLTHQRCKEVVINKNAHVIAEHTVAESCSGDGLIVASFSEFDKDLVAKISLSRACDSLFGDPLLDLAQAREQNLLLGAELAALRSRLELRNSQLTQLNATLTIRLRDAILRSRFAPRLIGVSRIVKRFGRR